MGLQMERITFRRYRDNFNLNRSFWIYFIFYSINTYTLVMQNK